MSICRERGQHRWDDPQAARATCQDCGVIRMVVRRSRHERPKIIYRLPKGATP